MKNSKEKPTDHCIIASGTGPLWKKGALQNPSKRFCRFPKVSKCVQRFMVLYRTLKVSYFLTEPFFAVQNLKKVLSSFLSVFWDFGHIWRLLEIYRTFSKGSAKLLFFRVDNQFFSYSAWCELFCNQSLLSIFMTSLTQLYLLFQPLIK